LRHDPRLAALLRQQRISHYVVDEALPLGIPVKFAPNLLCDNTKQRRTRGTMGSFNVRIRLLPGPYAIEKVQHVRLMLQRSATLEDLRNRRWFGFCPLRLRPNSEAFSMDQECTHRAEELGMVVASFGSVIIGQTAPERDEEFFAADRRGRIFVCDLKCIRGLRVILQGMFPDGKTDPFCIPHVHRPMYNVD
jgi:hypothetical protein